MKNFEKLLKTDISDIFFGPISITDIGKRTDITDIDIYIGKPIPKPILYHIANLALVLLTNHPLKDAFAQSFYM